MSLLKTAQSNTLPDHTQLAGRLFVVDAVNPNRVIDSLSTDRRPMGTERPGDSLNASLVAGTGLTPDATHFYGVRRIMRVAGMDIPSAIKTGYVQTAKYELQGGSAASSDPGNWNTVTDGAFDYTNNNGTYEIRGIDFTAADVLDGDKALTMRQVAYVIQDAVRSETDTQDVVIWDSDNTRFLCRSSDAQITGIAAPASGTDLTTSSYMDCSSTTQNNVLQGQVFVEDYEQKPPADAQWEIVYQVLRSKGNATGTLYLVAELTQSERDALSSGVYNDTTTDDDLDMSVTVNLNYFSNLRIPPVRCIRAWQGMLLAGGSYIYTQGTVSEGADTSTLVVNSPGQVTQADLHANIWIDGEDKKFRVTAVDTANGEYTLDSNLQSAPNEAPWQRWHDLETLYAGQPLPDNIEGYAIGSALLENTAGAPGGGVIRTNRGGNNAITGIAAHTQYAYVFRANGVELLAGTPAELRLQAHPAKPPGCASHATITDRYSSRIYYYAGRSGVWYLSGTGAKKISTPVDKIISREVDHGVDAYTHALYDPRTMMYYLFLFPKYWLYYDGNRIPSICLIYDEMTESWYRARLPASASGYFRDDSGRIKPMIAIGTTLAQIDAGDSDGPRATGTVDSTTTGSVTDNSTDFLAVGITPGQPIHVTLADGTILRRIVSAVDTHRVDIHGAWHTRPQEGDEYRIGAIAWSLTSPEAGAGNWQTLKKVERVDVAHEPADQVVHTTIRGPRGHGEKTISRNWSNDDLETLQAGRAGLRTRTIQVRVRGSEAPAAILAEHIVFTEVSR